MSRIKIWMSAFRLRTLPLSLSGILLGSFIAYEKNYWDAIIFVLAMSTTLLFQLLSNLANDLGDSLKGTDNAQRIGPQRAVQSGQISKTQMRRAVILFVVLSFVSAAALIYFGVQRLPMEICWVYIGLAIACVLAAITYTMGKKAYGYSGFGDLFVFIFFGWVSVLGVYTLFSKNFDWLNLLPASAIGLLSAAVLNLNNMRDRANDARSGKNTVVVKMGAEWAKLYHLFLILAALACMAVFIKQSENQWHWLALLPGLVLLIHLQKVIKTQKERDYDPELKKVALSTFAIALIYMFTTLFA